MGLPSILSILPTAGAGQISTLGGLPALTNRVLTGNIFNLLYVKTNIGGYFFDAAFRTEHQTRLQITNHPVQGGANISDHAYMEPAVVTIEIGMSDANPAPLFSQFTSSGNKSQSAFDALKMMQENRQPLDLSTRFRQYNNMLIESIVTSDDITTSTGMKATVTLKQIIMVDVPKVKTSARPQATIITSGGNPVATPVTPKTTIRKIEELSGIVK